MGLTRTFGYVGHAIAGTSYSTTFNPQAFMRCYIFMCSIGIDGASDALTSKTAGWSLTETVTL